MDGTPGPRISLVTLSWSDCSMDEALPSQFLASIACLTTGVLSSASLDLGHGLMVSIKQNVRYPVIFFKVGGNRVPVDTSDGISKLKRSYMFHPEECYIVSNGTILLYHILPRVNISSIFISFFFSKEDVLRLIHISKLQFGL